jgi:hypothetical protein
MALTIEMENGKWKIENGKQAKKTAYAVIHPLFSAVAVVPYRSLLAFSIFNFEFLARLSDGG